MGEGRDGGSTFQAWARAIHDASSRWDGIRYVSRQMNKGFACAIFERSGLLELRTEKLKARQVDELAIGSTSARCDGPRHRT